MAQGERTTALIAKWKAKLDANLAEANRQSEFAGLRLGVFAKLKQLERERRRIAKRLIDLDPQGETDYEHYLYY